MVSTDATTSLIVFISYAWSTEEYEKKVFELAERLMSDGISVIWDKWDLKEGQDKYAFMEKCVVDTGIKRVLLICDKVYATKANERKGGVGDETTIISSEVYGKAAQEKFIPVIFEKDDKGEAYCPAYIKTRIYIDLSDPDIYEREYEKLLRNLYDCPAYQKPALGRKPEWLDEKNVNLYSLERMIRQLKSDDGRSKKKQDMLLRQFRDEFIEKLSQYEIAGNITGTLVVDKISELKPLRDMYMEYLSTIISLEVSLEDLITDFMETCYNRIHEKPSSHQYGEDHYLFFIWELFICTIATLLYYEEFKVIYQLINHTFFLKYNGNSEEASHFLEFEPYLKSIEEIYPKEIDQRPRNLSNMADILLSRESKPVLTRKNLIFADVLLFQLSNLFLDNGFRLWFPRTYCYDGYGWEQNEKWRKLKSKKYCQEILPLFGVSSIDQLKELVGKEKVPDRYGYSSCHDRARIISDSIKIEEIASLP